MTESFERRMKIFRENLESMYDNGHMTNWAEVDTSVDLDHLQRAHDHEIEQLRRSRFREGYEAGQRSMDAEHYQLKLRLQGLKFGDGSHENLSRLAYAIYPCPTGWGKESCEGLRDELVRLLGGVHDEPAQTVTSGCACDVDCDCGHGDETAVSEHLPKSAEIAKPESVGGCEVTITDELRKFVESEYSETIEWYQHPQTLHRLRYKYLAIPNICVELKISVC